MVSRTGGAIVVDGDNSMGQIAGVFAMRRAIECARETGVAAAAVRGSNHAGAMDCCVRLAVDEERQATPRLPSCRAQGRGYWSAAASSSAANLPSRPGRSS